MFSRSKFHSIAVSVLLTVLLFPGSATAAASALSVKGDWSVSAPRWMYDSGAKVKGSKVVMNLYRIAKAERDRKYTSCLTLIRKTKPMAKSLESWLVVHQLRCSSRLAKRGELQKAIASVEGHPIWLLEGAQVRTLKKEYAKALLRLLELSLRHDRKASWKLFDKIQRNITWFNKSQTAKAYRLAGEVAFIQQRLLMAHNYFQMSLDVQESRKLRKRIDGIRKNLAKLNKKVEGPSKKISVIKNSDLESSDAENKLIARMKQSLTSGDLISAVNDGVTVITKYPGGVRASWAADRMLDIYFRVAKKTESKYARLKHKVLNAMLKCDAKRMGEWAKKLSYKAYFVDSMTLGKKSLELYGSQSSGTKVLFDMANAALYMGDFKSAEGYFEALTKFHAGSSQAEQSWFRLGLIRFRKGEYSSAISQFERLLGISNQSKFDLEARYWLWRSLQKTKSPRAVEVAEQLSRRYPLSYYGLRARAELNDGKLVWQQEKGAKLEQKIWLAPSQRLAWQRYSLFLQAGWFIEAQAELSLLPEPKTAKMKLVFSNLWAKSFDHFQAITLVNKAWEEDPSLVTPASIPLSFPVEFANLVKAQAKKHKLDESLVLGLIKQESSFRSEVTSPSNAMGLMQLIPSTARSVKGMLGWKTLKVPEDLFDPNKNIQLGTRYLRQMVRAFNGNVPLALAAYNAGIGRVRRWLRKRGELDRLVKVRDSNFENEIWIDELPWGETNFYVKAILRNLIVYRWLNQNKVQLRDPIWSSES